MESQKTIDPFDDGQIASWLQARNKRYLDQLKISGELSTQVLATILDCVADGLVVLDQNMTIVLANLAAAKLSGYPIENLTRSELHRHYQFFHEDGKTPILPDEEPGKVAMREKRPDEMIGYVVRPHLQGGGHYLRAHAAPILDEAGRSVGAVTVVTDTTECRRLARERDCLLSLIVHDLKNYLYAEQGVFELITQPGNTAFDTETVGLINSLRASNEKFLGITHTLIEMARAGRFSAEQFGQELDLHDLALKAVELSRVSAANRDVHVVIERDADVPTIRGLPEVVCHALHNLIQNAVEVSAAGSSVKIHLSSGANGAVVTVTDSGPGMNQTQVSQIFNPDVVAGRTPKTTRATGFGLYLTAMLIEGIGGTLKCDSELGKGTTLTVMLPAADLAP